MSESASLFQGIEDLEQHYLCWLELTMLVERYEPDNHRLSRELSSVALSAYRDLFLSANQHLEEMEQGIMRESLAFMNDEMVFDDSKAEELKEATSKIADTAHRRASLIRDIYSVSSALETRWSLGDCNNEDNSDLSESELKLREEQVEALQAEVIEEITSNGVKLNSREELLLKVLLMNRGEPLTRKDFEAHGYRDPNEHQQMVFTGCIRSLKEALDSVPGVDLDIEGRRNNQYVLRATGMAILDDNVVKQT